MKHDAAWYEVPERTGKGMLTDPYLSQAGVVMASASFPVMSGGKVLAIAQGAHEQSAGIKEIDTAVGHMDRATQRNAAMLEEAAAASEALRAEANDLRALVARFETSRGPAATARQTLRRAA